MTSEVTLAQCPIGLFWAGDELCLKTEYGNNDGRIDAYIVSTGEFFWGSHPQTIPNQRMQMVRPVPEEALARFTAYDDMQTEILRLREDVARLEMERTLSGEGRSAAGEDGLSVERKAVLQNPRVNDAIQTALERGELTVTMDGYLAALRATDDAGTGAGEHLVIVECSDLNEGWSLSINFGSGDDARDRMRALSDRLRAGWA